MAKKIEPLKGTWIKYNNKELSFVIIKEIKCCIDITGSLCP